MANLMDIVSERQAPSPWSEGDNIPWNDPGFSERMLKEHLSQAHDHASRRFAKIDLQVAWIHEALLKGKPTRVLDLGCGPGLYASRLARLGHRCVGIDYSPASIRYAREQANSLDLDCTYIEGDIRQADYGEGYGLAMLLYGEFNVFRPRDARAILHRIHEALHPDGLLLLEPHHYEYIHGLGLKPRSWYASSGGLFCSEAHLVLLESFWEEQQEAAALRYWVVRADTGDVTRHAQSMQAYTQEGYARVLEEAGFTLLSTYPSLLRAPDPQQEDFLVLVAQAL